MHCGDTKFCRELLQRNNKSNVLSDMHVLLSAAKNSTALNIRICDPKFILINHKQEASGLKILIFNSGRLQISRHIKQQGYCSVGYAIRQHKVSGSAIRDPRLIPINQQQEANGLKILILNSGRLQISRHISLVGTYPSAHFFKLQCIWL